MCGLFGLLDSNKVMSPEMRRFAIRSLGVQNEVRGRDSCGFGHVLKDGTKKLLKTDQTPSKTDTTPVEESYLILGHTRLGTIGEKTALQSHPFYFNGVMMTHNGTAYQDHNKHKWAHGESGVDSETMLRYIEATGGFSLENIARFEDTWSSAGYAIAALLRDNVFVAFRNSNPFHYAIPHPGIFMYASQREHLEVTLNLMQWHSIIESLPLETKLSYNGELLLQSYADKKEKKEVTTYSYKGAWNADHKSNFKRYSGNTDDTRTTDYSGIDGVYYGGE